MLPVIHPLIKVMSLVLAGSIVLHPVPQPHQEAGKLTNKIVNTSIKTILEKAQEKANPPAKSKQKLPIIAGYKPGQNPLPEGRTPQQNYQEAWKLLKNELGWK